MFLIGICGPSGSGKTELARAVARAFEAPILALDSYYRDLAHLPFEERARVNFDDPASLDHELLFAHLRALAAGCEVEVPVYDFTQHERRGETERLRATEFGVLEGLWTLYWEDIRRVLGTKVYIEAPDAICFDRRMARDLRERGRSRESVVEQYTCTVRPMAERYILPTREFADVVVSGTDLIAASAQRVIEHVRRAASVAPPAKTRERGQEKC
jgi:uridine kinase